MADAIRLPKREGFCEGWARGVGTSRLRHEFCDGGPGLFITRRGLWMRDGYYQCGTCKKRDDARLTKET